MKKVLSAIFILTFIGCKNKSSNTNIPPAETPESGNFIPVSTFFKGQITTIRLNKVNPLKYNIVNGAVSDSSWIQMEDLDKELKLFLEPTIDSGTMVGLFREEKFLDQSVNAFTFTYDSIKALPEHFELKHWDVYVNPETGKVQRVYLLKKPAANQILQLTWQTDEWCKMVFISEQPAGKFKIDKEVKIQWDF